MRGKLNDRDAKCPFFHCHTRESILCESPIPDSRIKINFGKTEDKRRQYALYCCKQYRYCELYRAVSEKYEEE